MVMKKITQCATIVCFFALTVTTLFAQDRCGTMDKHKALIGTSSEYRLKYDEALEKSKRKAASRESSSQGLVFKVPVVVHIMHLGEPIGTGSNISDDQVHSAISSMNDAYRKKTGSIYDGNGVDMEIEFCLAQKDPMGNPSSGIVRVNASATAGYNTNGITDPNEITIKALSKWPHNRYYNIWIVSEIDGNNGLSGVQGYALQCIWI
jgi:hypothetical protein